MRNFYQLTQGLDVMPLMVALQSQPELWNQNDLRRVYPDSPHAAVDDIWLRFNEVNPNDPTLVIDDKECINYPAFAQLPQARQIIFAIMGSVQGERLGRCLITRLAPGETIAPHEDGGAPATYYERYHIVLQGHPGAIFRCGDETVSMRTGEAWWMDNSLEHEVVNNSDSDRIHLICDIKACQ